MYECGFYGEDPRGQNFWDDLKDELSREFGDGPMRVEQGDPDHNPAFNEPEEVHGAEDEDVDAYRYTHDDEYYGDDEPDDDDGVSITCDICGYELDMFGVCRNGECEDSPEWHKYW